MVFGLVFGIIAVVEAPDFARRPTIAFRTLFGQVLGGGWLLTYAGAYATTYAAVYPFAYSRCSLRVLAGEPLPSGRL